MDKSWKIDLWKIHGKSNAKTMGKTMENSMGNSWEIHGKSLENKNGKKRKCFPGSPWIIKNSKIEPMETPKNGLKKWDPI